MSRFRTASATLSCCVRPACPTTLATPSATAAVAGQTFDPELVIAVAGLSEWPDEVVRRGIVTEAEPGRMAFRHALVRDAFYGDIPWTRRVALHQAVAERLETGHAASVLVAEHWVLSRRPEQARAALLRAAEASSAVHAYRDAERATRRALELWPDGDDEGVRLDVLERLAGYAELTGDLADAVPTWREVADRHRRDNDLLRLAMAQRRLAAVLELQGRWQEALSSREQAALAFTAAAHRPTPPPSVSPPPPIFDPPGASAQPSACCRSPGSRRVTRIALISRHGSWGTRAMRGHGWAKVRSGWIWSGPGWRWHWSTG